MNLDDIRHAVYVACRRNRFFWGTLGAYCRGRWWGVVLGRNCRFHGLPFFRRYPGSRIVIGAGCTFLSASHANLIGVNRPCMISTMTAGAEVQLADRCGLSGTVIGAFRSISLGEHVICGANTLITDSDWHAEDPRAGAPAPVVIGRDVWLGVNVIVLKGVTIGEGAVIGAGSIVTADIPPRVIAAGNPCRVIRSLDPASN